MASCPLTIDSLRRSEHLEQANEWRNGANHGREAGGSTPTRSPTSSADAAVDFYTRHFGFELGHNAPRRRSPGSSGARCGCLAGPKSSGRPMPGGTQAQPGGWNLIRFVVDDIAAEVERLRSAGLSFRNEIVSDPGGRRIFAR